MKEKIPILISLDDILSLNTAWNRVSEKTIVNCYKHAGFYTNFEFGNDDIPLAQWILKHANEDATDDNILSLGEKKRFC